MRFFVSIIFISFLNTKCFPQKEGNIWCFGDSVLIDWNDPQNPSFGRSAFKDRGSASSIADSSGNLLFYIGNIPAFTADDSVSPEYTYCADTLAYIELGHVYTKEHTYMENGRCISGEGWYNEHTIVPMPGNDSLYYIFTTSLFQHPELNYSVVDIKANGGLGKVIEKDVSVIAYTGSGGLSPVSWCIKAIRHGNGRDWWVISKSSYFNLELEQEPHFLLMLVTPDGVELEEIPIYDMPFTLSDLSDFGFNSDGTKMFSTAFSDQGDNLFLYDFDRCTGELSNQTSLGALVDSNGFYTLFWDVAFSPSGRFLYVNTSYTGCSPARYLLLQYDLEDENPSLTKDTLLNYLNPNAPEYYRGAGNLRLAPDGKIYYSRRISSCQFFLYLYPDTLYSPLNMNLSVINSPDSAYPACNFTPYSFYLGGARTYQGLPNNPNFALGAVDNFCDTSSGLNNSQKFLNTNLNIFPNPCYNTCQIQYKPVTQKGNIVITNVAGKVIFKEENIPVTLLQHGYEINTSAFAKGVYFVTLSTNKEIITKKMVKL
jgi:Secretion system C-terminal sorting domain